MKWNSFLLRARVPERRYRNAERILSRLGLKPGDAVNLLLAQIELRRGLPFDVAIEIGSTIPADRQGAIWTEAFGEY
jgi:addiction module RelB/DinJ family antitoxin